MSTAQERDDRYVRILESFGLGVVFRAIAFSFIPAWFAMLILGRLHIREGWPCNLSYLATVTIFQLVVLVGGLFRWGGRFD